MLTYYYRTIAFFVHLTISSLYSLIFSSPSNNFWIPLSFPTFYGSIVVWQTSCAKVGFIWIFLHVYLSNSGTKKPISICIVYIILLTTEIDGPHLTSILTKTFVIRYIKPILWDPAINNLGIYPVFAHYKVIIIFEA